MVDTVLYAVGLPTAVMGTVLVLAILLPPLRRRAVLADCCLAICLPGAALLSFVLEKGMILPGSEGWQKWFITAWALLCAALCLGLAATGMGRGRQYGPTAVLAAGVAGAGVALWLVLPGLDEAGARVTMGLKFALPVLAFAAAAVLRRDIVFHIGVWATAAALSMTMLVFGQYHTGVDRRGASQHVAAVAAVVLSVFPSSAPSKRVGLGGGCRCEHRTCAC